jgi:hypothetical protein
MPLAAAALLAAHYFFLLLVVLVLVFLVVLLHVLVSAFSHLDLTSSSFVLKSGDNCNSIPKVFILTVGEDEIKYVCFLVLLNVETSQS